MKKSFVALGAAALVAVATPFALAQEGTDQKKDQDKEAKAYEVGSRVDPKIALPDTTGKQHVLGDYKGQLVVIDFWSINCPWSKKKEQQFIDLHEAFKNKGVAFLAIDANKTEVDWDAEEPFAEIEAYVEKAEVTMPILIDRNNKVADVFGAITTPHVYIIDKEGVVRYTGGVDDNPKGEKEDKVNYVAQALDELLAGKEVSVSATKPEGCSIKRVDRKRIQ
jgi:peroxiredoxin